MLTIFSMASRVSLVQLLLFDRSSMPIVLEQINKRIKDVIQDSSISMIMLAIALSPMKLRMSMISYENDST